MATHIKDFIIHDYKGIHELKLNSLNSINVLVGDNNCGKTSVLEILSTVDNPHDTGTWVLCTRMQNVHSRNRMYYNGFYNMFPIDNDEKIISYEYVNNDDEKNSIVLRADIERMQISEKEMYKINRLHKTGQSAKEDEILDTNCMHLFTHLNGNEINHDMIFDFQTLISHFVNKKKSFVRTRYVSPVEHASEQMFLNDVISDPELYEDLLHILREFDDSIISVNAINTTSSFSEYVILTKKHEKALPLNAYGDGMKKALLLLSAIVSCRNGILLLDEFETAIHTSAMDSIFSWLLKSALKLNVQIFLTSHSEEAIRKLLRVDEELQDYINVYTLYEHESKNYVRRMTCREAINAQDNLGLELR